MRCGITGRRPKALPWGYDESDIRAINFKNRLKYSLGELIEKGYDVFNIGMAQGIDTYVFEILADFRDKGIYPDITLCAYVPSRDFASLRSAVDKERYERMLAIADSVTYICEKYDSRSAYLRNMAIVDNSDIIFAIYDGKEYGGTFNTVNYAKSRGIDVITEHI